MFRHRMRQTLFATALIATGCLPGNALAAANAASDGFTVLHSFPYLEYRAEPGPPSGPNSPLVEQRDGSLLGSTEAGGRSASGTVYRLKPAGGVKTIFSVVPGAQNAGVPMGPPSAIDRTTAIGAMYDGSDCGLIYALRSDRSTRELHDFSAPDSIGCLPSRLVQGDDGDLYGVADNNTIDDAITGEIFKVGRDGRFTSLYAIKDTDGSLPRWGLTKGSDGNFYGTTTGFGSYNYPGTVFRVTPDGAYTTLAVFGGSVGQHANSGVIEASDGNFYGSSGLSSVYRMRPDGRLDELVNVASLHEGPMGDLIQARDGYLYGATYWSVYRISLTGQLTLVHTLDPASEGSYPGGLMQASDGFIYGHTGAGGVERGGTLFKFWPGTGAR